MFSRSLCDSELASIPYDIPLLNSSPCFSESFSRLSDYHYCALRDLCQTIVYLDSFHVSHGSCTLHIWILSVRKGEEGAVRDRDNKL